MRKTTSVAFVSLAAVILHWLAPSCLLAENWPSWRGPRGDGSSLETEIPVRWSGTENIAWKIAVPHVGHASPIVWDNRVFLVGTDLAGHDRTLMAYSRADGKLLWEKSVIRTPLERKHGLNSYASSTPATDGESIFVSFLDTAESEQGQMLVAAYDFDGTEKWKVRPGVFSSVHGYCSSPVLFEDSLIVNGDHDGEAYIVALSKESGETLWKTSRENRTRSYCTPIIRDIGGRTQLLLSGNKCVASYDPHDGSRHWIVDGPTEQLVASLVYSRDLLFVTGGFPEHHVLAINPTGAGNITDSHIVWRHAGKLASYVPSPVAVGNYFVVASDNGLVTCLDATSGKIQWSKQLSRHYSASLVTAAGLVYVLDDDGVTQVVKPGSEFEAVAVNRLLEPAAADREKELCSASPAISQGQIFVRTDRALYCIGKDARAVGKN